MKILIQAATAKRGGAKNYLENLMKSLPDVGKGNNFIIYSPLGESNSCNLPSNFELRKTRNPFSVFLLIWQQVILPAIMKREKIDLLFSTANIATLFSPCPQILLLRDARYFSTLYLKYIFPRKRFLDKISFLARRFLIVQSAKMANILLFPSQSFADDFLDYVKIDKTRVKIVHYGVNTTIFSIGERINENGRTHLVYGGLYGEHKNFSTLFKALIKLKNENYCDFDFTAPLDWKDKLCKKCATFKEDMASAGNSDIKGILNFLGKISPQKLSKLYQKSDIFIWPTLAESFGQPLIEAMSSGVSIVASDIKINHEICNDSALYFDPLDPNDLALKINTLVINQELRKNLSQKAEMRSRLFRWDKYAKILMEIFEETKHLNANAKK